MTTTYGILGTYPPTQCGLATFSAALAKSLRSADDVVGVVATVDVRETGFPPEVRHQWVRGQYGGAAAAAAHLNTFDVVIVQHEYGIFGGPDGVDVLDVVRALTVPVIVVFHTVLTAPTVRQRSILDELARTCDTVVTMTWTARQRLIDHYAVDPSSVVVIPHGAADTHVRGSLDSVRRPGERPVILTWGLLGQGKGLEWGIAAMAELRDLDAAPEYRIVGQTHPKVLEWEGEAYRRSLTAQVESLGVQDLVTFDARYLETSELQRIVQGADIILLPYDSTDQVTSGVLVEAITAGKPVISTAFPHAVELLGGGMGLLVERQDGPAIAAAIRRLLTEPGLATGMSAEARLVAPDLLWPAVAGQYRNLAASLAPARRVPVSA
jgi:glycosyltransferase involved in cell wall biosynthesis